MGLVYVLFIHALRTSSLPAPTLLKGRPPFAAFSSVRPITEGPALVQRRLVLGQHSARWITAELPRKTTRSITSPASFHLKVLSITHSDSSATFYFRFVSYCSTSIQLSAGFLGAKQINRIYRGQEKSVVNILGQPLAPKTSLICPSAAARVTIAICTTDNVNGCVRQRACGSCSFTFLSLITSGIEL